jgi:hypothetical protein
MNRLALAALALSLIVAPMGAVADERDAWASLVSGSHVALVRHGNAPPGYGDPPGFKIDDCATQRNLDELGRAQARAVGEAFRQQGVQGHCHVGASEPFLGSVGACQVIEISTKPWNKSDGSGERISLT